MSSRRSVTGPISWTCVAVSLETFGIVDPPIGAMTSRSRTIAHHPNTTRCLDVAFVSHSQPRMRSGRMARRARALYARADLSSDMRFHLPGIEIVAPGGDLAVIAYVERSRDMELGWLPAHG